MSAFEDWKYRRLPNWGASQWAALMSEAPDSSCENPIWQSYVWTEGDEGYGEITETTVIVLQEGPARAEHEPVDDADAEVVGAWVRQLPAGHRGVLSRRYVLREKVGSIYVDAAIYAILGLIDRNQAVVRRMAHG